jgi:pyruvate-formate lyase-activating enzyme
MSQIQEEMKLEDIGFYTLCDHRAENIGPSSPMWRCEIIITDKCNFRCSYCRELRPDAKGTLTLERVKEIIDYWAADGLRNIRFSGGEPTIHPDLLQMVKHAKAEGVQRIAISTNGSNTPAYYDKLIKAGVNDFSVSLDSCCSAGCDEMSGTCGFFDRIISNIRELSKKTYVTVGIVVTDDNIDGVNETIEFAHSLGVADIRVISAAQYNRLLHGVATIPEAMLRAHPILQYRVNSIKAGRNVRGLRPEDTYRCHLVQDDSAVAGDQHFPCIIYLREQGKPIGEVGPNMRKERVAWFEKHDTHQDPICQKNCLDVCIDFNNACNKKFWQRWPL